jgi:hypothetical protein
MNESMVLVMPKEQVVVRVQAAKLVAAIYRGVKAVAAGIFHLLFVRSPEQEQIEKIREKVHFLHMNI